MNYFFFFFEDSNLNRGHPQRDNRGYYEDRDQLDNRFVNMKDYEMKDEQFLMDPNQDDEWRH